MGENELRALKMVLNNPLIDINECRLFAEPGIIGLGGGAFNPGALVCDDEIIVIAKGQKCHWHQIQDVKMYMRGPVLLFRFDYELNLKKIEKLPRIRKLHSIFPEEVEDFRMFRFQEEIYLNHSLCHLKLFKTAYSKCTQVLSTLDLETRTIRYVGAPRIDFCPKAIEKNWVYFSNEDGLFLLYSFCPFVVLKAVDPRDLKFVTVINQQKDLHSEMFSVFEGNKMSFSTNPIPYDDKNLLVVIHSYKEEDRIGRVYFHWAVLLDKKTFVPVKISSQPIFVGGKCRGKLPGVMYVMSVIPHGESLIFFNGEGDSCLSFAKIEKKRLERCLVDF
jgi:predicted GH43/DUF377 family glycosyl hydrolase